MIRDELVKIHDYLKSEFLKTRVGRASIDLVEDIKVEVYGTKMPLNELATLSAPEPRLVVVQPWDKNILKNIEKALRENLADFNPIIASDLIRIPFPAPSAERRKVLVKEIGKIAEEARIKIRRAREDAVSAIEAGEQRGEISEDELHRQKDAVQRQVDEFNRLVEEERRKKEEEIMSV